MKKFNWELPADPDPKSDNYYNGIVSKELGESYTETDLKDIAVSGQTFIYFGEKCRIYARPLNI